MNLVWVVGARTGYGSSGKKRSTGGAGKIESLSIVMGPMGGKAVALKMGIGWGSAGFV